MKNGVYYGRGRDNKPVGPTCHHWQIVLTSPQSLWEWQKAYQGWN